MNIRSKYEYYLINFFLSFILLFLIILCFFLFIKNLLTFFEFLNLLTKEFSNLFTQLLPSLPSSLNFEEKIFLNSKIEKLENLLSQIHLSELNSIPYYNFLIDSLINEKVLNDAEVILLQQLNTLHETHIADLFKLQTRLVQIKRGFYFIFLMENLFEFFFSKNLLFYETFLSHRQLLNSDPLLYLNFFLRIESSEIEVYQHFFTIAKTLCSLATKSQAL